MPAIALSAYITPAVKPAAAHVAHNWPGREMNDSQVRSAAGLLKVIEECARDVGDGVYHVPDRRGTDPEPPSWPILVDDDEPVPDYTEVKVGILRAAIRDTQAIRHARATNVDIKLTLTKEQIEALDNLCHHPALSEIWNVLEERFLDDTEAADRAAIERAVDYLALLDDADELDPD